MQAPIHIGTSGWSYKHWRGLYYPQKLAASKWLPFYAQTFTVSEINASFYRLPSAGTVQRWMEQVPAGFRFCPKMSRYLTHMKKLRDPEEPLQRFFSIFDPVLPMLGPVLIQLPPMLPFHRDVVLNFYQQLKMMYSQYEFVVEVRHSTWLGEDSIQLMKEFGIGLVISQSGDEFPYAELITAKNIYLRFHGPGRLYASPYKNKMLWSFAEKMVSWAREGHVVWAFFNNDIDGYAPVDAEKLLRMVQNKEQ